MSRLDIMLKKSEASLRWLSSKDSSALYEYLFNWKDAETRTLKTSRDDIEIRRAQGRLEVIDDLLKLKDEVLNYRKGVESGKFKPPTEE